MLILSDIVLRSLKRADRASFTAELARCHLAEIADAVPGGVLRDPVVLARYVGPRAARKIRESLRATGAEVFLRTSRAACQHCGFSLLCEGEPTEAKDGVLFSCRPCGGLTLLSVEAASFAAVLRCSACRSLVMLPKGADAGPYPCACGRAIDYEPPLKMVRIASILHRIPIREGLMVVSLLVFLAMGLHSAWLVSNGPNPEVPVAVHQLARPQPADYQRFDKNTGYNSVLAAMGKPPAETLTLDGRERILYYRAFDLYVVLERSGAGESYEGTVRISDGELLHKRPRL